MKRLYNVAHISNRYFSVVSKSTPYPLSSSFNHFYSTTTKAFEDSSVTDVAANEETGSEKLEVKEDNLKIAKESGTEYKGSPEEVSKLLVDLSISSGVQNKSALKEDIGTQENSESPWYLRDGESSPIQTLKAFEIPPIPASAPPSLKEITQYVGEELGFTDVLVFDLSKSKIYNDQEEATRYVIIGTAKSDRHVSNASTQLITHIKYKYSKVPYVEGLVTNNAQRLKQKRLQKRARKYSTHSVDDTYGCAPNSWVMAETKVDNIFVNLLTAERREKMALELLWCAQEDRDLYQRKAPERSMDDIFSGLRRYHTVARRDYSSTVSQSFENKTPTATEALQSILNELNFLSAGEIKDTVDSLNTRFSEKFPTKPTQTQWNMRLEFLYKIHLISPNTISVDDITRNIYAKQAMTGLAPTSDLKYYIKLIIDSPEYEHSNLEITSLKLNRISTFVKNNWNIVNKQWKFDDELVLLLLKLVTQQPPNFISPKDVETAIKDKSQPKPIKGSEAITYFPQLKSILLLVKEAEFKMSLQTYEFLLSVYGNAHHRHSFFECWDSISFNTRHTKGDNEPWLFLMKLVSMLGSEKLSVSFLEKYWYEYLNCGGVINDDVKMAVRAILDTADAHGTLFNDIREAVN